MFIATHRPKVQYLVVQYMHILQNKNKPHAEAPTFAFEYWGEKFSAPLPSTPFPSPPLEAGVRGYYPGNFLNSTSPYMSFNALWRVRHWFLYNGFVIKRYFCNI